MRVARRTFGVDSGAGDSSRATPRKDRKVGVQHSIFAMEVCARLVPESPLRSALAELVASAPERMSLHQKWLQYQRGAQLVLENLNAVERGCWDYFNDDARALKDYEMWTQGMMTQEGVREGPLPIDPYRGEPRYLTFTMSLLIVQDTPSDLLMLGVCTIPEAMLWKRESFARILRGMAQVSFASVVSDVMYLLPRDEPWALTLQDLQAPKFEYLRPLEG